MILSGLSSLSNPLTFQYTDTVKLIVESSFTKCWPIYLSQWSINKINSSTGQTIQSMILPATVILNNLNLTLPLNGALANGVYQVFYQLMLPSISQLNTSTFIKVLPAYFDVLGFYGERKQSVGPFDSISFEPSFFSFDPNGIVQPTTLSYQFYCILIDSNTNQPSNFNQTLYSIKPNVLLSSSQISSSATCFKSSGE